MTRRMVTTQCGRMDHGGCTLRVEVEDGRIASIKPDPSGPLSQGHMCVKGRALAELHQHPQRLTRPLKRAGRRGEGRWTPISWDEALGLAAEGLNRVKREHGARGVAFCQGAPKGLEHFTLIRLANTFGSPNVVGPQNVCHMPREIPAMLTCGFFPVADYDHPAQTVLVWGSNLTATNEEGVICTRLTRRIDRDRPMLIVIDPRRTDLARRADRHLAVRPGTDAALALAMLNEIISRQLYDADFCRDFCHGFDDLAQAVTGRTPEWAAGVTGLDPAAIRDAAHSYAQARPGLIQWGNGIEQNQNNFQTSRALLALMAVTGNLDLPGGNVGASPPPTMRLGEYVRGDLLPNRPKEMISAAYGHAPGFVIAAPEHFKRAALTGRPYPVRAAYVQVSNPVLAWSHPASTVQALKALDFLVVTETFPSPTSAWADLVLPAATHLEYNDLGHYGLAHGFVLARPRAVDPPGQCRPNPRILNDLAHALGLGQYWWDDWEGMLEDILAPSGWSYQRLAEEKILRGTPRYQKYKDKGFKTPTGKVELRLSRADKHDLPPLPAWDGPPETTDPDFPLTLTGHKSRNFFCSDHRYLKTLRSREPEPTAGIHPDDAAAAGVRPGEEVMVESRHGRVVVTADVTDDVAPGVVSLTVGWWRPEIGPQNPESYQSITYNTLTAPDQFARPLGTPNLRGLAVRIRPAG